MAYKVRRQIKSTGGTRVGGTSHYTDIAKTTGRLTMAGSARVYKDIWLGPEKWYAYAPNNWANMFSIDSPAGSPTTTQPWSVAFGNTGSDVMLPVLASSAGGQTDQRAATTFYAPADADSTVSPSVYLWWTTRLGMATTGSMFVWRFHYDYKSTTGSVLGGSSGSRVYCASLAHTGSGKLAESTLGTIPAFQTASPFVSLQLIEEGSNASSTGVAGSTDEVVFGVRIRYIANVLGAAV